MLSDFLRYEKALKRKKMANVILHLNDMWLKRQWKKTEKIITSSFRFLHENDLFHLSFYFWRGMESKMNGRKNIIRGVEIKSSLMDQTSCIHLFWRFLAWILCKIKTVKIFNTKIWGPILLAGEKGQQQQQYTF